ncbi:SIMPL domain-containing protein [Halorussus halophilus]|uniref:SIMPL domain-containing protein n=1 Tax=Halorussus halophilus TaxID=2650975 RepID=UPI0013014803|nr:SIMPL domain-containing protein [Halorussus halophilus]
MADRTITTGATGETQAPPDEAIVQFDAKAVEPDVLSARRVVAEQSGELRTALAEVGISEERIKTAQFRVTQRRPHSGPETNRDPDELPYKGRESLVVTLHDLDAVGDVLSAAVEKAGVEIDTVSFGFQTETKRELEREALTDAATTARQKAEAAADAEGLTVEGVVSMTTGEDVQPRRTAAGLGAEVATQSAAPSSGPLDVSVALEATYELRED